MECPRCHKKLTSKTIRDINVSIQVDHCNNCGGTWFDEGELSVIDTLIEPTMLEIRKIPNMNTQLLKLECPSCNIKHKMIKTKHPRDSKVIMDFCETCKGIWLDKGELDAIQKENWLITLSRISKWLVGSE